MSPQENAVRIGKELGLCPEAAAPFGVQLLPSLNRKIFQSTIYGRKNSSRMLHTSSIIIIYLFAQKHFKNGLMAGGIKG